MKFDLQQERAKRQQTPNSNGLKRPLYSSVAAERNSNNDGKKNLAPKNMSSAPDNLEGKQNLILVIKEEISLLTKGIQNLENKFQIVLNTM